ncbi:MAG: pentapeptide repeat-containing protein [Flavobacteriales bacterium]|nr:pentapeptide repeat-containing protein [Flavobacteriales bacterium]
MVPAFHQDELFTATSLRPEAVAGGEFERCVFRALRWMDADLTNARFTDCVFEQCDLSNARVRAAGFRTVEFAGCKLLGVPFDQCSAFLLALRFTNCRLDFTSFRSLVMKGTHFHACSLIEADLSGTDLGNASFVDCDLAGAVFDGTNLEGADLREARNFTIDPERNRIKGAHFSLHGLPGLLMRHGIKVE